MIMWLQILCVSTCGSFWLCVSDIQICNVWIQEYFAQHHYITDGVQVEFYIEHKVTDELRDERPQQHKHKPLWHYLQMKPYPFREGPEIHNQELDRKNSQYYIMC